MKYNIRNRTDEIGTYYWVTKKWFIFEWQISPSIFFYYKDAKYWLDNNMA